MNSVPLWTELYKKYVFGIVIYTFDGDSVNFGLNVKDGDLVRIYEEKNDWYRCMTLRTDIPATGLVPKSFIKIVGSNIQLDSSTPENVETQVDHSFIIWSSLQIWIFTLNKNRDTIVDTNCLVEDMYYILRCRELIANKLLDSFNFVEVYSIIKEKNNILHMEENIYQENMSAEKGNYDLFQLYYKSLEKFSEFKNKTKNIKKSALVPINSISNFSVSKANKNNHILINLLSIDLDDSNEIRIDIYLYNYTLKFPLSETYTLNFNSTNKNDIINNVGQVIFTDLKFNVSNSTILLIFKIYRKVIFKKDISINEMLIELPVGVVSYSLKDLIYSKENSKILKLPIIETIDKITAEDEWNIVRESFAEKDSSNNKENFFIEFNIKCFSGIYSTLKQRYPNILAKNLFKMKNLDIMTLKTKNKEKNISDFYLTLNSGTIGKFVNLKSKYMINAAIAIKEYTGEPVKDSIICNINGTLLKQDCYTTGTTKEVQSPYWNETVKFILPQKNIESYYISIRFLIFYEENGLIKIKDKEGLSFSILRLSDLNNGFINDGLKLTSLYKVKFKHDSTKYISDEIDEARKKLITLITTANNTKEEESIKTNQAISYTTKLISNIYTTNKNIFLIKGYIERLKFEEIDTNINIISYAESSELAKFEEILFERCIQIFFMYVRLEKFETLFKFILTILNLNSNNESDCNYKDKSYLNKHSVPLFSQKFILEIIKYIENETKKPQGFSIVSLKSIIENTIYILKISIIKLDKKNSDSNAEPSEEQNKIILEYFEKLILAIKGSKNILVIISEKVISICYPLLILLNTISAPDTTLKIFSSLINSIPDEIENDEKLKTSICFIDKKAELFKRIIEDLKNKTSLEFYQKISVYISELFKNYISKNHDDDIYSVICCIFLQIYKNLPLNEANSIISIIYKDNFERILNSGCKNLVSKKISETSIKLNCLIMVMLFEIDDSELNELIMKDNERDFRVTDLLIDFMASFIEQMPFYCFSKDLIYKNHNIVLKTCKSISEIILNKRNEYSSIKIFTNKFLKLLLSLEKTLSKVNSESFFHKQFASNIIYTDSRKKCLNLLIIVSYCIEPENKIIIYDHIPLILEGLMVNHNSEILDSLSILILDLMYYENNDINGLQNTIFEMHAFIDTNIEKSNLIIRPIENLISKMLINLNDTKYEKKMESLKDELQKYSRIIPLLDEIDLTSKSCTCSFFRAIKYYQIMNYFKENNFIELYKNNLIRLIGENEKIESFDEAARCIIIYADTLDWNDKKLLPEYLWLSGEQENVRKEMLYLRAIEYFKKSFNYENAFKICKLISSYYERHLPNYKKLEIIHNDMAQLSKLIFNQSSLVDSYYQLKFTGPDFPKFTIGKSFIVKLGKNVSLGGAMDIINTIIPFAKIKSNNSVSKDLNNIKIQACICQVDTSLPECNDVTLPYFERIMFQTASKFKYNTFTENKSSNSNTSPPAMNVFKCVDTVKKSFPFLINCSIVDNEKIRKSSELDQTISMLKTSITDLSAVLTQTENPESIFKMIIMKLQGNLIAKVNGGIDQLTEKYFVGNYFTTYIEESDKLAKLKSFLSEFMNINYEAISKIKKLVPDDYIPLYDEIRSSYSTTRSKLLSYEVECKELMFEKSTENLINTETSSSSLEIQKGFREKNKDFFSFVDFRKIGSYRKKN